MITYRSALISGRMPRRLLRVNVGLLVVLLFATIAALFGGAYPISFATFIEVLSGGGDAASRMIVLESRLPRVLTAVGVGIAFGIAG
ncbi:MAG: iron chelate uptake ABC transporter family permease subunit, partial [Pseudomonadota bacterium]